MGAALYSYYTTGTLKSEGSSITEGIGQGRITKNLEGAPIDIAYQIPDEEAVPIIFDLLEHEGLCLGGSSGINVAGAVRLAKELGPGHTIVTMLADYGTRYQSKLFNPQFLREKKLPVPPWLERRSNIKVPLRVNSIANERQRCPLAKGVRGPIIENAMLRTDKTLPQRPRAAGSVSTDWLAEHLRDRNVVAVDGSYFLPTQKRDAHAEYRGGHIPGAVFFDIEAISDHSTDLPHMLPGPTQFGEAVGALGIGDGDTVVVYDSVGFYSAPRVWWTFRIFGAKNVYILDGGLPKWKAEGRPLENGDVKRPPKNSMRK